MDWVKIVWGSQKKEDVKKLQNAGEQKAATSQKQEGETSWQESIMKKIQEASREGLVIHVKQKPNRIELYLKGKVEIECGGSQSYAVIYRNVVPPSKLILSRPIMVYHHRQVKLRQLTDSNIEEILMFVMLGMEKYCQAARFSRIERNLEDVIEISNIDERV